jgi:RHS repeat-associated protein
VKVWTATYNPFGGVYVSTGSLPTARFPGQWFQSESGLHQNWMRDYDPTTGRYLQADPLGLVDGASVYGYVRQSTLRYFDPRGEEIAPTNQPPAMAGQSGWNWKPDAQNSRGGTWQGLECQSCSASWDEDGRHWDVDEGNGKRQRYSWRGRPLTADQAHMPNRMTPRFPPAIFRCLGAVGFVLEIYELLEDEERRWDQCLLSGRCT